MNLRVITFNIRNSNDKNGNSIAERAPRLFSILHKEKPDILGMQESMPAWRPLIEEALGGEYEIFDMPRSSKDVESVPLLWRKDRFDCTDRGHFWLSETPDEESNGWDEVFHCYRICLWAKLRDKESGKVFIYLNTHYGFGDRGQVASDELIVARMNAMNLPYIVSGDFNMQPEKPGYIRMAALLTDVNAVTKRDFSTTYHGYDPAHGGDHIDYCFVSREWKPTDSVLLSEKPQGGYPSDHYGLLSLLSL